MPSTIIANLGSERDRWMTANDTSPIYESGFTVRDVCQVLREVTLGRLPTSRIGKQAWDEMYASHFQMSVYGWLIMLHNACDELDYCEEAVSTTGQRWAFDPRDRYGTDPVALLSTWKNRLLNEC